MSDYEISTDRARLDMDFIIRSLHTTYWAESRPHEVIRRSFDSSLVFGAFKKAPEEQVGFARIVTDGATFSWLCDVYVSPAHRGKGIGKRLVAEVIAHPSIKDTGIYLGTRDAHGLYEQFGFCRWELMRRPASPNPAPEPTASAVARPGR
jgi:GNAT superfamily N-acetyltransferase